MTYADQLLNGVNDALELEFWELAESMARVLARHIHETGEYPSALPKHEIEQLVREHARASAYGPS
jgi:hypothetical protein